MKKLLSLLFVLGLTLSTCGPSQTESVPPAQTSTLLLVPTATQTPIPPTSTVTPLPTIPTFTPTFDDSTIVTVTPAEKAKCPKENQTNNTQIFSTEDNLNNTEIAQKILDSLNQGIPKSKIIRELANFPIPSGTEPIEEKDLTNDGVLELIFQIGNGFAIYKCNFGKYEIALSMVDDFGIHFKRINSTA